MTSMTERPGQRPLPEGQLNRAWQAFGREDDLVLGLTNGIAAVRPWIESTERKRILALVNRTYHRDVCGCVSAKCSKRNHFPDPGPAS